jgi:hypothetical protein
MSEQVQIDFEGVEAEELTQEETQILSLLQRGRNNALSVRHLAECVGVTEVRLREMVRHLIDVHGACIGSSTSKPPGYFLIESPLEIDAVYKSLRHRGIEILRRAANLKKISIEEVFNQGVLEL